MSKTCTKCRQELDICAFGKLKSAKDGLYPSCKTCKQAIDKAYYNNNIDKVRASQRAYLQTHRETYMATARKWQQANRERTREYARQWSKKNRKKITAKEARRRASKLQRIPKWAHLSAIQAFYDRCPPGFTVDHIFPLQGELCSGLHVLENLQYLRPEQNSSKSNKMPENVSGGVYG